MSKLGPIFRVSVGCLLLVGIGAGLPGCGYGDPTQYGNAKAECGEGASLERAGNWKAAYDDFEQALKYLEKEPSWLKLYGGIYYEMGRCLGVMGQASEAERYLRMALEFDQAHGGPTWMDYTELARLNFDGGKYAEAVTYFESAFRELDKMHASDSAPGAYCDVLAEYSRALEKVGRSEDSAEALRKLASLAAKYPNRKSITERTPYFSQVVGK